MEKENILLVDDEAGIRKVLGISLRDAGYEVLTAGGGGEALSLFTAHRPRIVLTDIKMPGMDGIELLKRIKAKDPEAEVIMITGHGDMDLAVESLKHEATDFITKPISDEALEIALKRAHDRIAMRRQLREYTDNLEELVRKQSARLVEMERLTAVGQAVEGLSSALSAMSDGAAGELAYFNEMPCFVSIHTPELTVAAANQLYKERLGDKVGGNSWEIYPEKAACPVARTFETGAGQRSRQVIRYADGREVPVMVYTAPIRNREGDLELAIEIAADMEEIRRLQGAVKASRHRYQQLFDAAPCYITVQDEHLRLMEVNERFKEDFGGEIGAHCYEVYKHRSEPCPDCPVTRTFEDGEPHQSEMVVTTESGEQNNVLIWTAPLRDEAGRISQVMELSTNITQIRQLQDHLSSLGMLIGSISHGIKGLLTGLDGGMYLLSSGFEKENEEQIKEGWEVVKLMAGRIRNMVLNILYYAKERDLQWERVDVLTFAEEVAAMIEPKAKQHGIALVRDFDTSVDDFEVDPGVVRSALVNILENALDACLEDKEASSHEITFGVAQEGDEVIFDIRDNGLGMDRETREHMFTLFFSSKRDRGTGLGLFISNKIIRQHQGSIEVESAPGEGSRFRIRMPKVPRKEAGEGAD